MDVSGLKPTNEVGEYFRANVWAWASIHAITAMVASDLIDEQTILEMQFNEGGGVRDGETCQQIADRISAWAQERALDGDIHVPVHAAMGNLLEACRQIAGMSEPWLEGHPTGVGGRACGDISREIAVDVALLLRWAHFLRHCGGFAVW
jgi:hypothetical protein